MEDNTEHESHTLPELPFEERKFAAVTELLALNDIPINPDDALEREFTGWLVPRLLEKRMLFPLPPLNPEIISQSTISITHEVLNKKKELQEKVKTALTENSGYNTELESLIMYSSAGLSLLKHSQKTERKFLFCDLTGLRNSNLVHQLEGNRRLRKAANVLQNALSKSDRLGAWGGDELVMAFSSTESYLSFCASHNINPNSTEETTVVFSEHSLAYARGEVFHNPVSVSFKPSTKNFLERPEFTNGNIEGRKTRLIKFHHELEKYITHFEAKLPQESFNTFLWILENSLFDPLLQKVFEGQSGKYSKQITGYKDIDDLKEHLTEENGEYALMRVDLPGIMKYVNDFVPESYLAGNALIKYTAERIISFLLNECGLFDIRFMRRGIDFYVVIPRSQKKPPLEFTDLLLYAQELQRSLMSSAVSFVKQDEIIHVVSHAASDLYTPCVTGYAFFSGGNIGTAMDKVDNEVKNSTTYRIQEDVEILYRSYMRVATDEIILENQDRYLWFFNRLNYLGNYFNVYEKRGPDRIQEHLGVDEAKLDSFLPYYDEDSIKVKDGKLVHRLTTDKNKQFQFLKLIYAFLSQKK